MRKFSLVLILLGVVISIYPLAERGYTWYWQQKILREYETEKTVETSQYHQLQEVFEESIRVEAKSSFVLSSVEEQTNQEGQEGAENHQEPEVHQQTQPNPSTNPATNSNTNSNTNTTTNKSTTSVFPHNKSQNKTQAIGILKINRINLNLPILQGATEKNLKIGGGLVAGTTPLGEIGNTAIAGHRSHTYGRFFNRLDELEVGDELLVEKDGEVYRYQVYKKHVVSPEDTSVLNRSKRHQVLTLITCHPLYKATERLVIHALRVEGKNK